MLNANLDIANLAEEFAANKSLVIDNYLDSEYVEILYNWFNHPMPEHWGFASYRATASGKGYEGTKYINHLAQNKENIEFEREKANYSLSKGHFSYMLSLIHI